MRVIHLIEHTSAAWNWTVEFHLALRKAGVDSRIISMNGSNELLYITEFKSNSKTVKRKTYALLRKASKLIGISHVPNQDHYQLAEMLSTLEYDILFVYSARLNLSYLLFPRVSKHRKIIFLVTSMWGFTGHCHYSYSCDRWKSGCGNCPSLDIEPAVRRDATRIEWHLKNWAYKHSEITVVTMSKWLTENVRQSMLNRFSIHEIPQGIDTDIHIPHDTAKCRQLLGIPQDKNVLMFAAENLGDYRKGNDLLLKALESLPSSLKANTVLIMMGKQKGDISARVGIPAINLGFISYTPFKTMCYSSADLFLFPTRAETFGLVSVESQACGTPVVSFRVSGIPDHVRPGITGYLAEPESVEGFRNAIIEHLNKDQSQRSYMRQQCRKIAVEEYSMELCTKRFIDLFKSCL